MICLKNLEGQIHLGNKESSNRYVISWKVENLRLTCVSISIEYND